MTSPADLFFKNEGDNWFKRNQEHLAAVPKNDLLCSTLEKLGLNGKKILDVGCSNGHRLATLGESGATCFGIEPSAEAVADGRKRFPKLRLERGVSHDLSQFADESFDIVYLSYVFHWVERRHLLQTISEVDRVLKDSGMLIINDFYPDVPHKRRYHHRPDVELYTYKQDYGELFAASRLYALAEKIIYEYGNESRTGASVAVGDNSAAILVLKKNLQGMYPVRELK